MSSVTVASACECPPPVLRQLYAEADAVFLGSSESIVVGHGARYAQFRVTDAWKGLEPQMQRSIVVRDTTSSCGVGFAQDATYLVLAKRRPEGLVTDACMGTANALHASAAVAALGVPAWRVDPQDQSAPVLESNPELPRTLDLGPPGFSRLQLGLAFAAGFLLGILVIGRWRRRSDAGNAV